MPAKGESCWTGTSCYIPWVLVFSCKGNQQMQIVMVFVEKNRSKSGPLCPNSKLQHFLGTNCVLSHFSISQIQLSCKKVRKSHAGKWENLARRSEPDGHDQIQRAHCVQKATVSCIVNATSYNWRALQGADGRKSYNTCLLLIGAISKMTPPMPVGRRGYNRPTNRWFL